MTLEQGVFIVALLIIFGSSCYWLKLTINKDLKGLSGILNGTYQPKLTDRIKKRSK